MKFKHKKKKLVWMPCYRDTVSATGRKTKPRTKHLHMHTGKDDCRGARLRTPASLVQALDILSLWNSTPHYWVRQQTCLYDLQLV